MSWLKQTKKYYQRHLDDWQFAADHLSGEAGTYFSQKPDAQGKRTYLYKRKQGESDEGFEERMLIRDFTPHFMSAVVSLAGMLWSVDDEAQRSWSMEPEETAQTNGSVSTLTARGGLGDPEEEGTIMNSLWQNADGAGLGWDTTFSTATVDLIAKKDVWCVVDGIRRDEEGNALNNGTVRILPPESVLDWVEDSTGRLTEVKVCSTVDERTSVMQDEDEVEEYTVYQLDGATVWREGDRDEDPVMVRAKPYGDEMFRFWSTTERRIPVLPIFRVQVPIRANVGALMARKANAIYNQESARDFHLWASAFARYLVDVATEDGGFNKDLWDKVLEFIIKGQNVLPGPGGYVAPPMDGAEVRNATLEQKKRDFYTVFFQSYGDAARERTATELRQDWRSGVEAYLKLLASAVDELENGALWRLEQIDFPDNSEVWGGANVKRSTDFEPVNIEERVKGLKERYFPSKPVPVGEAGLVEAVLRIAEIDGLDVDRDDVEAALMLATRRSTAEAERAELQVEADRFFLSQRDGVAARRQAIEDAALNAEVTP